MIRRSPAAVPELDALDALIARARATGLARHRVLATVDDAAAGITRPPWLPWYRGAPGAAMEPEAAALVAWVGAGIARAPAAIALDVHSGFGLVDRLWFPWARTRRPMPNLAELRALTGLLDASQPHHVYRIEPQARAYTIQGDLWDHLYGAHLAAARPGVFLPLTLESTRADHAPSCSRPIAITARASWRIAAPRWTVTSA